MHSDDDTIRLCGIFLFIHLYFSACYIGVVSTHLECVQNTGIVISDGDRTYRGVERLTVDARSMQDVNTLPIPATLPIILANSALYAPYCVVPSNPSCGFCA